MDWRKLLKAVCYPCWGVMILLLPIATVSLVYVLIYLQPDSVLAVLAYLLAFYTLTVWIMRLPVLLTFLKYIKTENKYISRWRSDTRLRIKVTLYGSLIWNTAYALLQLGMGLRHHSFWFYSLAGYYGCLAVMRFFLARYTARYKQGERMRQELVRYRLCGWIFLAMNLTLSLMVFFMVYWNRTFEHHPITTIALAAYTFATFTRAIINIVKYRKYNSPIYSAAKAISLASACVSMLTLEATMLTTFHDGTVDMLARKILLGCTGGAVSIFIIVMAVSMIIQSSKKIKIYR